MVGRNDESMVVADLVSTVVGVKDIDTDIPDHGLVLRFATDAERDLAADIIQHAKTLFEEVIQ